jgi:sporulation protein YlmC with PRC-barrel domain
MTRLLLAGVALAAMLATGAVAQSSSSAETSSAGPNSSSSDSPMSSSSAAPSEASTASGPVNSAISSEPTVSPAPRTAIQILSGYTTVDTDRLASKLIGAPVYDGKAKDSNNLGSIKDLIVDENGNVAAVVVGVGGFLGLGEKQVAVDFHALQFVIADDNTERYVLQTTKDELTNAPDFKTVDDSPASSSAAGDGSDASSTTPGTSSSSAAM